MKRFSVNILKLQILIIGFIATYSTLNGQDTIPFFLDEISLSVNRTNLNDKFTKDKNGFGIGAYHSFLPDKTINIQLGFEFNRLSIFKKLMYSERFSHYTDLTYKIYSVTIPLGLRINIGNKLKFVIETGGYCDNVIYANQKGIKHTSFPDSSLRYLIYKEYQINENAGVGSSFGLYLALGIKIPVAKYELIIKPEYKRGINNFKDDSLYYQRYFRLIVAIRKK